MLRLRKHIEFCSGWWIEATWNWWAKDDTLIIKSGNDATALPCVDVCVNRLKVA